MSEHTPAWNVHLPDEWRSDTLELLTDESLPGRWTRRWLERPAWPQVQDIDDHPLTSLELEDRTRRVAQRLLATGLNPGDRFVISASTTANLVIAYIAALRAGLVVVPLNTGYTRTEVARIVADAQPAGAAVDNREHAAWISEAAAGEPVVVGIEVDLPDSADEDLDRATRDDPALLVYTSGTTGRPKGALLTHGNLLANATAVSLAWRWQHDDRLLLTLPLFHVHGLAVGINGTFTTGASVVLRPKFDVKDVFDRAAEGTFSLYFGVPAMYQRLASTPGTEALRRLRLCVSGSAPLPPTVANAIAAATGQVPLERYGMTETIMLTSNPYEQLRKVGTVGFPFPGVELRLADAGEVEVRGPNVIGAYWQQPAATAQAFTADGWFRTGDLGEFDEDGYLRLVGRSKDLIITGGYNVHPREVEEVLLTHPGVRDAAVVGRSSDEWGEEVTAVVIADGDVPVDELRAHAAENLAAYKVPKKIEFVDDLPRNALGKVLRHELR